MSEPWSGGCQCGAVRFRAGTLGRASLCHCRMCQKAFGGIGGLLVTAHDLTWTRGHPGHFASSDKVRRGFCRCCGTPLTFEPAGGPVEVAIAAFDRAREIMPTIRLSREARLACFDGLVFLPDRPASETPAASAWAQSIVSNQHPDHDTEDWQVKV